MCIACVTSNMSTHENIGISIILFLLGPREPWHDIHSKVEGRIAYDVFENFWERWQRQGLNEGEMIHVNDTTIDIDAPLDMDPQKAWNVQFFRSITSDSAVFDEKRVDEHVSIH